MEAASLDFLKMPTLPFSLSLVSSSRKSSTLEQNLILSSRVGHFRQAFLCSLVNF